MLNLNDTDSLRSEVEKLAARVVSAAGRARLTLRCADRDGRLRLLTRVAARIPDVVWAHVPSSVDQTERVILELATELGVPVVREVDAHLREEPEVPRRALDVLREALGSRRLVVEGWDRLGAPGCGEDLGHAIAPRSRALREFLEERADLFTVSLGRLPAGTEEVRWPVTEKPFALWNGSEKLPELWARFCPDVQAYELALALLSLEESTDESVIEGRDAAGLRSAVIERLPESVLELLRTLAIHGRPLQRPLAEGTSGFGARTLEVGTRLGLFHETPAGLMTDDGWQSWWAASLGEEKRSECHLKLARQLGREARPGDPEAGRAGLSLLEAHRHFLAGGDFERALAFARYGVTLCIDHARALSQGGRRAQAAELYELSLRFVHQHQVPVGKQLLGYALHYLHFNRAHEQLEPLEVTEDGYREALDCWPGNALFWSRFIRVLFYRDRPAEALEAISRAESAVAPHPLKKTVLQARTVRGLLERDRPLEAILVWNDYQADSPQAQEVEDWLSRALLRGWRGQDLTLEPGAPLVFSRPMEIRLEQIPTGWLSQLPALETFGRGAFPIEAIRDLVKRLRDETKELVRALTGTLDAETRLRKQRLLAAVDIAASRLDADTREWTWVLGDLARDDKGQIWLDAGGSLRARFEVPPALAAGILVDAMPHFARVKTGYAGAPVGPVLQLEPGYRGAPEALWEEWRRRFTDAG